MNQHLKTIQTLFQQNKNLSEADKEALLKAIADADKQWSITEFKLDKTEKIKKATAILLEETIEELEQKRKAVEAQNRELEIESSLEKVRTIAMGMRSRDDMLDICRIMSVQLESLGIKEIRNVQTAIFYKDKGTYINYEYYRLHDKTLITEVDYTLDEISKEFAAQMLKGASEIFIKRLTDKQVKEWLNFQKTTNVFIDTHLENVTSLTYYWFSLGPVALGISTYQPLNEPEINLFKRFRNVFGLAYQRYADIEKAEAQAREAKIEAALEKVRSRSMAMQKSEELKEVIQVVYEQFVHLNISTEHAGFVMDYKERDDRLIWVAGKRGAPSRLTIPYFDSEYYNRFNEAKNKGWDFFATNLGFEEKNSFYQELFTYIPGLPEEDKDFYFSCPGLAISTVLLENVALYIENFEGIPYSDEDNATLMRFGKVFQQTYTRFLDLQKAEAQAREAKIETGLERVRARTMAMHDSKELADTATVLFQQFQELGLLTTHARPFFSLFDTVKETSEIWSTKGDGSQRSLPHIVSFKENKSLQKVLEAWKRKETSYVRDLRGNELTEYLHYLGTIPHLREEKLLQQLIITPPERLVVTDIFFAQGSIGVISFSPASDEHKKNNAALCKSV